MLFNSTEFLFVFLPVTLAGFYLLGTVSRNSAIRWLILLSLLFYAWWRPVNVLIIAPSIIINYVLARILRRLNDSNGSPSVSKAVLLLGISFNVIFLGVFKYTDFVSGAINDVFGANLVLRHIILPLGISFITFQKIAFLVDVQAGKVRSFTFQDYCTFVLFFPQLIAGPIVHYREMMPQFHDVSCRFDKENFAVGLTLLSFGLFKKIILADQIALLVTPLYQHAATEGGTSFLMAWMAAIGFTLQLYFDFSGYTDMALGLARFFGIRLPQNFDSPLRASSIIDFWLRWHMTLTRFLTAYIYNPLQLWLTRRRLAKGQRGFGGPNTQVGAFVSLLMFPTILTMFVSGFWHGAGYGFIVWGLLHGLYLTINHGWRVVAARLWPDRKSYVRVMKPVGWVLTFVAVTASMVFFRSATITSAVDIMKGLMGLNGVALPQALFDQSGPLGAALHGLGVIAAQSWTVRDFAQLAIWISVLMFVALACPNTLQILSRYEPALGVKPRPAKLGIGRILEWDASLPWAIVMSGIAAIAIASISGPSEFLYWQF
ncbi:MBOAT family O-acyltransferase [Bradyrhizobium sp.]|uniref:MBOAT family O-acyltransferase n=1 Tax=Bradyrhizobium sp. TaxID=376 RepID=UPI003C729FA3